MQYLLDNIDTDDLQAAMLDYLHDHAADIGAINDYLNGGTEPGPQAKTDFGEFRNMVVEYATRTVS